MGPLTVDGTERGIASLAARPHGREGAPSPVRGAASVRAEQAALERILGLRVRIRDRKGKGKIVIEYASVDDYDRVVEMLKGKN